MALGSRAARSYLFVLGTVFPLAAPFFASGGGYGRIMDFKASLYLALTAAFVLISLFDLPRERGFFRSPPRLLALGYLFFCLLILCRAFPCLHLFRQFWIRHYLRKVISCS